MTAKPYRNPDTKSTRHLTLAKTALRDPRVRKLARDLKLKFVIVRGKAYCDRAQIEAALRKEEVR